MADRRGFALHCDAADLETVRLVCERYDGVRVGPHDGEKVRVEVDCWHVVDEERDVHVEHVRRELEKAVRLHRTP